MLKWAGTACRYPTLEIDALLEGNAKLPSSGYGCFQYADPQTVENLLLTMSKLGIALKPHVYFLMSASLYGLGPSKGHKKLFFSLLRPASR